MTLSIGHGDDLRQFALLVPDPWPGFTFKEVFHHPDVVTCAEAAKARGVPLAAELKSIVLRTGSEFIAAHLNGHRRLDSKAIKRALGTKSVRFATPEELAIFDLQPGLINPISTGFCTRHLISRPVMTRNKVTTNAGVFNVGVSFAPQDLLSLKGARIGDFCNA